MSELSSFGKMTIFMGLGIAIVGIIISLLGKLPSEGGGFSWLGKLPGDFLIKRDNFTFYFPLTTSIIISSMCSCLLYCFIRR